MEYLENLAVIRLDTVKRERKRWSKKKEFKWAEKCVCKIFHRLIIIVAHVAVQTRSGCKFNKTGCPFFLFFQASKNASIVILLMQTSIEKLPQSNSAKKQYKQISFRFIDRSQSIYHFTIMIRLNSLPSIQRNMERNVNENMNGKKRTHFTEIMNNKFNINLKPTPPYAVFHAMGDELIKNAENSLLLKHISNVYSVHCTLSYKRFITLSGGRPTTASNDSMKAENRIFECITLNNNWWTHSAIY